MNDSDEHNQDSTKLRTAMSAVYGNNNELAINALEWIFHSVDLEPDGFYQTCTRLEVSPEAFKKGMLDRSRLAREFVFGKPQDVAGRG